MKKRKLKKNIRHTLTALLVLFLVGLGGGLAWSFSESIEQEEEYTAYSYTQNAEVDYRVQMKSGEFFEEELKEPGKAYLSELTESIMADLHYHFEGEEKAKISGTYAANATLEALTSGEEQREVWQKDFTLVDSREFSYAEKSFTLQEEIEIPFAEYRDIAEKIKDHTNYNPGKLNLNVEFDVEIEVETDSGSETKELNPSMIINMRGSTFVVEGNLAENNSSGVTATRIVKATDLKQARIGFAVSAALVGIVLVGFMTLTYPVKERVSPQERKVARLLQKHQERIVTLSSKPGVYMEQNVAVDTFEDLLKVADELQKPIFYYQVRGELETKHIFLVFEKNSSYKYRLTR